MFLQSSSHFEILAHVIFKSLASSPVLVIRELNNKVRNINTYHVQSEICP